ncbi:MAG TPA: DUF2961 domain-containing protein [Phycisphaerae bacterium]|nr:DUF2961 domain-containing protein [Phycisphaerae bacterium]
MNRLTTLLLATATVAFAAGCVAPPIQTGKLVQEMTDFRRLTESPSPAYKTVQFSSYDRHSNLPGGPGWFANSDGFGGEELPGFEGVVKKPGPDGVGEYLICDVKGPGAIVRTWTAAMEGQIRLNLDGRSKPLYEGPAADFLLCPYAAIAANSGDPAAVPANILRQHQAAYCPIPFAGRCRMVWKGNLKDVHFYQVQIRRYAPDAVVQTFEPRDLKTFADAIINARRILGDPAREYPLASRHQLAAITATIAPHQQAEVLKLTGPQALERLTLKVQADDADLALRQTLLQIIADDYPTPQVDAPVGDFFGAAPGVNPFNSLPFDVSPDGTMTCRYMMPFASSLRIVLDNRGDQPVKVTGSALPADYAWNDRSMHFRARWRVNHGVVGSGKAVQDMPFLFAGGSGRYVGTALMLLNPCRVPTLGGGWWGEGDEKVFIDNDKVPSTFGTGSEDYFDYAWSAPDIFSDAYCGQPRNDGYGSRGFVTNHRWQILDDLPFRDHFAFFLELFPHDRVPGMSYARIGYYYARPGTYDDHVAVTDEDLRRLELPDMWQPATEFVFSDATILPIEDLLPAPSGDSFIEGRLWAGGKIFVWRPAAVGDTLGLSFSVPDAGDWLLYLAVAHWPQAGRIAMQVDGVAASFENKGEELDLYDPLRTLARQYVTKPVTLTAGPHALAIVFKGAPDSVARPTIGLDYLAIKPAPKPPENP